MPRWSIEAVHRSVGAAEVIADAKRLESAHRATAKAVKEVATQAGVSEKALKEAARAHVASGEAQKKAADRADQLVKRQAAINRIMRETGASVATARKAAAAYGTTLDKQGDRALQTARELDALEKQTRELSRAQRAASKTSGTLAVRFGGLSAAIGGLAGAAGLALLARATADSVRNLLQLQSAERALAVATGDAAGSMAFVRAEVDRLGLSIGPTASEFGKLSAAAIGTTLAGQGVRDIFSAVAEASSVLGLSADQQAGALTALGQIMSKGTVQAEELRGQLGERIPGAFQIMARGLGVTTQELNKMLEQGKVLAEDALPAFAAELRKSFGTDSQKRIETLAAKLSRVETAAFEARSEFAKGLAPALEDTADMTSRLISDNARLLTSLGKIAGLLLKMGGAFAAVAVEMGSFLTASRLVAGLEKDIAKMTNASNAARESIQGWQAAIESADAGRIAASLAEVRAEAADVEAQMATLRAEAEKFPGRVHAINRQLEPLQQRADLAAVAIAKLEHAEKTATVTTKELGQEVKLTADQISAAAALSKSLATDEEKRAAKMREATALFEAGALSARDYNRALREFGSSETLAALDAAAAKVNQLMLQGTGAAIGELEKIDFDPFAMLDKPTKIVTGLDLTNIKDVRVQLGEIITEEERIAAEAARIDQLWADVGDTAMAVADMIGGEWGNMLGTLAQGVQGIRGSFEAIQGASSKVGQALGGFQMGGQIAGIAQSLGFAKGPQGTTKFGAKGEGDMSSELGAAGGAIGAIAASVMGGPIGAAVGSLIGGAVGTLVGSFIKKGADEGLAQIRQMGDDVVTQVTKSEGPLGKLVGGMGEMIAATIDGIEALLGGEILLGGQGGVTGGRGLGGEDVSAAIKVRGDEVIAFVNGMRRVFSEVDEAVEFLTVELIKSADFEGMSARMATALSNMSAETFEELEKVIAVVEAIEIAEGDVGPVSQAFRALSMKMREIEAVVRDAGLAARDAVIFENARIQAIVDGVREMGRSLTGAQDFAGPIEDFRQAVLETNADLDAQRTQRAQELTDLQELAAATSAVAGETTTLVMEMASGRDAIVGGREAMSEWGLEIAEVAGQAHEATMQLSDVTRDLEGFGEALEDLPEQIDFQEVVDAATVAAKGAGDAIIGMVRKYRGEAALTEQQRILEKEADRIHLANQIANAMILLELTDALTGAARTALQTVVDMGLSVLGDMDAGAAGPRRGGGGGGGGRGQARRQAAEDFRNQVARMSEELAGATDRTMALADAQAELAAKGREARLGVDEIARGLSMLAQIQLAEITDPFAEASQTTRRTGLQSTMDEIRATAQAALDEALVAAAGDPAAYRRAAQIIASGTAAQMAELGRGALGGRFSIREESAQAVRDIRTLGRNLEDFGITARQLATSVRDQVLPRILDIAIAEAQRVGDTDKVLELQQRKANLERIMLQVELRGLRAQLVAADALDAATERLLDDAERLLNLETPIRDLGDELDNLGDSFTDLTNRIGVPPSPGMIWDATAGQQGRGGWVPRPTGAGDPGAAVGGRTLADIIAEQRRQLADPMELIAMDFEAAMQRIADATGTAAERALAAAQAEELRARAIAELTERVQAPLRSIQEQLRESIEMRDPIRDRVIAGRAAVQAAAAGVRADPTSEAANQVLADAIAGYQRSLDDLNALTGGGNQATIREAEEYILGLLGPLLSPLPTATIGAPVGLGGGDPTAVPFGDPGPAPGPVLNVTVPADPSTAAAVEDLRQDVREIRATVGLMQGSMQASIEQQSVLVDAIARSNPL